MKNKEFGLLFNVLGFFFILEGILMLVCIGTAWYYHEDTILSFSICGSSTTLLGIALIIFFKRNIELKNKRYSYLFVTIIWICVSLFATLPYLSTGTFTNFTDALFEAVSGFATSGASVLSDIDSTPKSILLWRSITHWIGGMGIIMLVVAVLPFLGISSFSLYSAEVSGASKDKLHPTMLKTAQRLWNTYIVLTVLIILALYLFGMNFFDAVNHAFSVISTGGFSTRSASVSEYTPALHYVLSVAMLICSINFALIYYAFRANFRKVISSEELRFHACVILFAVLFTVGILKLTSSYDWEESLRLGLFQVATTISTTGLVITDFTQWTPALTLLILVLMLYGGMAGSTSGGLKSIRLMVLLKNTKKTLKEIVHSRVVDPLKVDNRLVQENTLYSIMSYSLLYAITFAVGVLLLMVFRVPALEALGGGAAALSGCGVGLGTVGGFGNYLVYSTPAKWVYILLMLLGRLELITIYILFFRSFWKK